MQDTPISAPLAIRLSQRARQVRLVVKPTGLELVVPLAVSEAQALRFYQQHRDWAERKLTEVQGRALLQPPETNALLVTGGTIPFQGRDTPLRVTRHAGDRISITQSAAGVFEIALPSVVVAEEAQVRSALFAWVKRWMGQEAARLAHLHGEPSGLLPRAIRIKRMQTRWGSCGPRNDINLNWILAFTPPAVLEYVVVHELCHIRHRNHSAEYWSLVAQHLPAWPQERHWLKQQGGALLRRFA